MIKENPFDIIAEEIQQFKIYILNSTENLRTGYMAG